MTNSIKNSPIALQCPTCQTEVFWNDDFPQRPFCSERCQLVDFGSWATERHRIEGSSPDFLEDEIPDNTEELNHSYN